MRSHHRLTSRRQHGSGSSPTGPVVGTAPHATQPPESRNDASTDAWSVTDAVAGSDTTSGEARSASCHPLLAQQ